MRIRKQRNKAEAWISVICVLAAVCLRTYGGGTIDQTSGWYQAGSTLEVNADPDQYSWLEGWTGDTNACTQANRQILIPVDHTRDISAVFLLKKATKGTTESWLALYDLTNSTPDEAELLDQDGDGAATWEEYVAGTDPTNRLDFFDLSISYSNSMPCVWFDTRESISNYYGSLVRHYGLVAVTDIMNTNWPAVSGYADITGSGQTFVFTNSVLTNRFFYRARVWLE